MQEDKKQIYKMECKVKMFMEVKIMTQVSKMMDQMILWEDKMEE